MNSTDFNSYDDQRNSNSRDSRDDDLLMQQVRAALTPMPSVDRRAIASILASVAQRRPTRVERLRARCEELLANFNISPSSPVRAALLISVAVMIGFVARGAMNTNRGTLTSNGTLTVWQRVS